MSVTGDGCSGSYVVMLVAQTCCGLLGTSCCARSAFVDYSEGGSHQWRMHHMGYSHCTEHVHMNSNICEFEALPTLMSLLHTGLQSMIHH